MVVVVIRFYCIYDFFKFYFVQMSMNQDGSLSGGGPICTVVMSSTHDQPPKISPSVMLSDRIEPPQHIQPPTFYVRRFRFRSRTF